MAAGNEQGSPDGDRVHYQLAGFFDLCQSEFVEDRGCVFCEDALRFNKPDFRAGRSLALVENEFNKQYCDYSWGKNEWEIWQNNMELALVLKHCWEETLTRQFPERQFIVNIHNQVSKRRNSYGMRAEIMTAVRLWSAENEVGTEMSFLWPPNSMPEEYLMLIEGHRPEFVPLEEVFTLRRRYRKEMLRRLMDPML